MVLLGAGASVDAGVPHSVAMTARFLELASYAGVPGEISPPHAVLCFVVGGLANKQIAEGVPPDAVRVNIEDVLNAVLMLEGRRQIEAAPFVGNWLPTVEELDRLVLADGTANRLDMLKHKFRRSGAFGTFPENPIDPEELFDVIKEAMTGPGAGFSAAAMWMLPHLEQMVTVAADAFEKGGRAAYYRDFVVAAKAAGATIATLNYDDCLEQACRLEGIEFDYGLSHWSRSSELEFTVGALPLLRIHGSVRWRMTTPYTDGKPGPERLHLAGLPPDEAVYEYPRPLLLFGGRNKLTPAGPFLDLLQELKRQVHGCNEILVVGYSFADEHVNEVLMRWAQASDAKDRVLRVYDIQRPRNWDVVAWWLEQGKAEFVEVEGANACLPKLFAG